MLTDEVNGGFVRIVFRRATGKTDEGVNGPVNGSVNGPVNEKIKEALEIELETQLTRFLLELGTGFAYLGRQKQIVVAWE